MNQPAPAIFWFREDLRLTDNAGLHAAVSTGRPLVLLFIHDEQTQGLRPHGGASRWWLDKSLRALAKDIQSLGGQLTLRRGASAQTLDEVIAETGAESVFWSRRYDKAERDLDASIKESLKSRGVEACSFNSRLLNEPWDVQTGSGGYYKVFTPYWKAASRDYRPGAPHPRPSNLKGPDVSSEKLESWGFHPHSPDWSTGFNDMWTPGEAGAQARLDAFLDSAINGYKQNRNRPDLEESTSGLSPHLRFGEIGPAQIWRATTAAMEAGRVNEADGLNFLSEVGWREFSHTLLFYNPDLATENYNTSFRHMPWRENDTVFRAWTAGQTGYPMVDAGMRQLWQTGWMHNRVRMIVASFLTKHLLLHWRKGEAWFWDTLVDADPANNPASWQWTAGSGADAAPYFRIFNPITQGEKFDETGDYVRRFCPELKDVPIKYLFAPWEADGDTLAKAGVKLGETYPHPIVDHPAARERALEAYEILKEKRDAA